MRQVHIQAAANPETLRISIDTKSKVKIGEFSRGGQGPREAIVRAATMTCIRTLCSPAGILEVDSNQLNWSSAPRETPATSWRIVWDCGGPATRQSANSDVRRLSDQSGQRPRDRRFPDAVHETLSRVLDRHQLTLELAYYPPYHSKYNLIERCWGSWKVTGTAPC